MKDNPFTTLLVAITAVTLGIIVLEITEVAYEDDHRQLPYTRPHLEFVREDEVKCAAWILMPQGQYVVLCENEPVELVQGSEIHGMKQPTKIYLDNV